MGIVLKNWYGEEKIYDHDKIFVRDENGELVQFTQGAGEPSLEELRVTENGVYSPPDGVDGFSNIVVEVPGGSSADVRYVTFMSHDGLIEYGKKAVATGDDCADPIARGIFDTPTRESDAQYNYSHRGWATEVNGSVDTNWYKAITEDKTVYASFESIVRNYTITFYDDDGTTVLNTVSKAYGSVPNYVPIRDGYTFVKWVPSLEVVTNNASYTAVWEEKVTFAGSSWAKIAEISESGKAKEYFAIGDSKTVVTSSDKKWVVKIIGFDHDDLADGSGKAGITCMFFTVPAVALNFTCYEANGDTYRHCGYGDVYCSNGIRNTSFISMTYWGDTELRKVVKPVIKKYNRPSETTIRTLVCEKGWIPSLDEVADPSEYHYNANLGTKYEFFESIGKGLGDDSNKNTKVFDEDGNVCKYIMVRDCSKIAYNYSIYYLFSGDNALSYKGVVSDRYIRAAVGFCI